MSQRSAPPAPGISVERERVIDSEATARRRAELSSTISEGA